MKTKTITIEQWIHALESGRYRQGDSRLVWHPLDRPVEYCCLGVACQKAGLSQAKDADDDWAYPFFAGGQTLLSVARLDGRAAETLEQSLRRFRTPQILCVPDPWDPNAQVIFKYNPDTKKFDGSDTFQDLLVSLNDEYSLDFKQIAQVLRRFCRPQAKIVFEY
jgi:hypothetical protein